MLKLFIIEDDPLYRQELMAELVENREPALEAHVAGDLATAAGILKKLRPDIALLDLVFPLEPGRKPSEEGGRKAIDLLRTLHPGVRVVALSGQDRDFAVKLLLDKKIDD